MQVYKGALMGSTVAIKVMQLKPETRALLAREIALARTVQGENLVGAPSVNRNLELSCNAISDC